MGYFSSMIVMIPGVLLAIWAQAKIKSAYSRYSKVPNKRGVTGSEIARSILYANGITDVAVELVNGVLSDHYDPRSGTLRLSPGVYDGRSVAAVGIAAHETGHALQHYTGYAPLALRSMVVPVASIGSNLAWIIFFLGAFIFRHPVMMNIGILLFSGVVVFTLITLPVEFNASSRAIGQLVGEGIIDAEEESGVKKVLNAAALTYVAAALMAILQLLRMFLISRD